MKELLYIYKIMLRHYGYFIAGIIFMLLFAVFSGFSITMAVPFFDYVFPQTEVETIYTNWSEFWSAIRLTTAQQSQFFNISSLESFKPLVAEYGYVMERTDSMLLLKIVSLMIFILILLKNIFFYAKRLMFANLNGKTTQDIRNIMFTNYMSQSLRFYSRYRIGDTLVRMVTDVEIISRLFITSMFNVLTDVLLVLIYMRIALFLNYRLFLISLIILPVTTIIVGTLGKKIKKYARRIQSKFSDIFSHVEEVLTNIKIVKAFGREKEQVSAIKTLNRNLFLFWRKAEIYNSFGVPISEINGTIIGVIILLVGGRYVLSGTADFSFGEFGAFLLAVFSMLHPIKNITKTYNDLKKAMVSLRRVSEVIHQQPDLVEDKNAVSKKSFDDKIEFDNVSFAYEADLEVLKNINFSINKGEKVAVVGNSGSGKTTISNLLMRLYDTNSGEIIIDGVAITKIKIDDLRALFGVVTQESLLFSDTIAENIRFGSHKPVEMSEIVTACKIAYADEFIEQLTDKYEQMLYGKGANLSGGQKQRLCIARAIVANPPILVFDEATSSLDTEAEQKVQIAMEQATKQRTVFIIAHRLSTILSSDKIIVLDKGEIIGIGNHEYLMDNCPKYKDLYELQFNCLPSSDS